MAKNKLDDFIKLPLPDDSVDFFTAIKELSEEHWTDTQITKTIYGFQIQKDSKWKSGLSDKDIEDFQSKLKVQFPKGLRNFYQTMNGLTKPGINVYGNDGTANTFSPVYYSYPDDLELIKQTIEWILDANSVTREQIKE